MCVRRDSRQRSERICIKSSGFLAVLQSTKEQINDYSRQPTPSLLKIYQRGKKAKGSSKKKSMDGVSLSIEPTLLQAPCSAG